MKEKHNFRNLFEFINKTRAKKVAVVDIETTGLKPDNGLIVEIGIVELDIDTGVINVLFDSAVKEAGFNGKLKYSWIFNNSDLKYEDVLNASDLESIKQKIQQIFNHYHLTSYNKSFDFSFLQSRGFLIKRELPDIMEVARNACKIIKPNGELKYPNFQEAWDFFFPESDYFVIHRALDDALHEALVLFEMYQKGHYSIDINKL